MVLPNKSMPVPHRINRLYPSSILKPFITAKDTLCLCFGLIVMSVYQTLITHHSPNIKQWGEGYIKTLNCAKDTQSQLERTLGKAMSLLSNRMINVSVPIASGIFRTIPS